MLLSVWPPTSAMCRINSEASVVEGCHRIPEKSHQFLLSLSLVPALALSPVAAPSPVNSRQRQERLRILWQFCNLSAETNQHSVQ